jgi:hypothetical protein
MRGIIFRSFDASFAVKSSPSFNALEAGGWRLEAGGWRLEAGGWRLEAGGCKGENSPGRAQIANKAQSPLCGKM